jgi:hypothetical protein
MTVRSSKYHPRRINRYCPAMGYHAGLVHGAPHEVNFGAMAIANTTLILVATAMGTTAGSTSTFASDNTDPVVTATSAEFPNGPGFGRCLQVVASGAQTSVLTVKGRDYLGQPMVETFQMNGATPVIGVKAFKWIDLVSWSAYATTDRNLSIGTTDKLGLPFRMDNVLAEMLDNVRVATLGTLVTPSLTDPATATTTDPRGTYDPQSTLDGTAYLSATFLPNGKLNSSGNGGLHGLAHYYA